MDKIIGLKIDGSWRWDCYINLRDELTDEDIEIFFRKWFPIYDPNKKLDEIKIEPYDKARFKELKKESRRCKNEVNKARAGTFS